MDLPFGSLDIFQLRWKIRCKQLDLSLKEQTTKNSRIIIKFGENKSPTGTQNNRKRNAFNLFC